MVDSYSKWLGVEILSHCDTKNTTLCLSKWFSQYGTLVQLISENGTQFTSQEFKNFIKTLDIKHIRTAAYHQSSNGQAERYVQTVKNGLESNYSNNKTLKERLFDFLTSYRSTPHTVTNQMPVEMFIGRNMRTRIDLIKPYLTLGVNSNPHKNNLTLSTLSPNDHVIVRRYGSKQKWQHGKIVERISCKMYKVLINGKIEEKHIDQIKKKSKQLKTVIPRMTFGIILFH